MPASRFRMPQPHAISKPPQPARLATRLSCRLAALLSDRLAKRLSYRLAPPLADRLAKLPSYRLAPPLSDRLAKRRSYRLGDCLTASVSARLAARLAAPLAALLLAGPAAAAGVPLTLCYEDVAQRPWSAPDATGLNFELLRRAAKLAGEQFIYAAKPWRRCIEELRLGTVDGVIAAADSRERRAFASFPLLADGSADPARALFTDSVNVFLRVGGRASWDGRTLVAPNMEVAVQSGYLVASVLRERGYRPREMGKSAEDGLRLLLSGMFDVAILQGVEASRLVHNDARFQNQVVQAAQPYRVVALHLPFNRELYFRNPRRVEAIWRAVAAARQSPEYRHLEAEAGVRD